MEPKKSEEHHLPSISILGFKMLIFGGVPLLGGFSSLVSLRPRPPHFVDGPTSHLCARDHLLDRSTGFHGVGGAPAPVCHGKYTCSTVFVYGICGRI